MFGKYAWQKLSQDKLDQDRQATAGKLSYHDSSRRIISIETKDYATGLMMSQDMRLAVLEPTNAYMPTKNDVSIFEYIYSHSIIHSALSRLSGIVAIDIETRGTEAHNPDCKIVGIGMADAENIYYFDFETNGRECNEQVLDWLRNYQGGFVGHNVFFDGAFLERECGVWLNWKYDTYGLYKQLATEGYTGQRWGLKQAQLDLLRWETKGDVELDEWLVRNGHVTDTKLEEKPGYYWVDQYTETGEGRWCKPRKGDMWQAPAKILGYYCALDTASTWQLLHEVMLPSISGHPYEDRTLAYHDLFMTNVRLMVSQQLTGITIDRPMLENHRDLLQANIANHTSEFLNHPDVRPYATEYNQRILAELAETEPTKFKKKKPAPKEPKQFKKNGEISQAYINWQGRMEEWEQQKPEITSHWKSWSEKVTKAKQVEHLNPNSGDQLRWLFYECLDYPVLMTTDSGQPSTGAKALPGFGEIGQLLKRQKDDVKELSYVESCLDHLQLHEDGEHRLHPQFRMPGTLTCRLAGSGGLNLQQIPKSKGYLECWRPKPGRAWVVSDHNSLEQVVLAELSGDESLWKIYGPNANPNQDVYLFNGSRLPVIGDKIRAEGYDPDNPTAESVAHVKKICKKERGISKVLSLGSSYGMGPSKLQLTLALQNIKISEYQARKMHQAYWDLYSGVKAYEAELLRQYDDNNGWVLNGVGRPIGCARDYLKDIVNRVVQSTGHDIHMMYIEICDRLFQENNVVVTGIVWDFHDESIVECAAEDAELVHYLMGTKAYEILNDKYLKGQIPLKGDPEIVRNMAEVKCE